MSQLTLTPQEDVLVLSAVRAKAAQFLSAFGVDDADLVALLAKIESQLAAVEPPEVAIAEAEAMEAAEEVKATKTRKSKAAAAEETPAEE